MRIVNERDVSSKEVAPCNQLSPVERHLLLAASLQFLLHRVRRNMPVTSAELSSLVALADDLEVAV